MENEKAQLVSSGNITADTQNDITFSVQEPPNAPLILSEKWLPQKQSTAKP